MGFFDSLKKAAKDVVGDLGNIAKEAAGDIGASIKGYSIMRPSDLSGTPAQVSGFSFEVPGNVYLISTFGQDLDFTYKVSFDEDDCDELDKASIAVQSDFTAQPKDSFKNFVRYKVNEHPVIFERVTFKTEPRVLSGISVSGKENIVYRFRQGGAVKDLSLSIPDDCPRDEAEYAKKAFELIAATFAC